MDNKERLAAYVQLLRGTVELLNQAKDGDESVQRYALDNLNDLASVQMEFIAAHKDSTPSDVIRYLVKMLSDIAKVYSSLEENQND